MTSITQKITIKINKYTASKAFQDILPTEDKLMDGQILQHQWQLKQVDGDTKLGHKFGEDTPQWGKQVFRKLFHLIKIYGENDPREWVRAWLNYELRFPIKLREEVHTRIDVHPWFILGVFTKEVFDGMYNQIEAYCKIERKKRKDPNFSQPLEFYDQMAIVRGQKNTKVVIEQLPTPEEIPEIEEVEDLHDINPLGQQQEELTKLREQRDEQAKAEGKEQCDICGQWFKPRGISRHKSAKHPKREE